jgi:hypothetical protein
MAGIKTTRLTDEKIIGLLKQAETGMTIKKLCRGDGFSKSHLLKV